MEEITRNDLNFFQNEILKDMKSMEKKLNEKITIISTNFQNTSLLMDQKYENIKVKLDEIEKSLESKNAMETINNKLEKFNSKLEEKIVFYNTKIAKIERDLSNACFKYDKIFLNNISSPGLIGDGCPYPSMKVFLEYMNNKMKEMLSSKEKFAIDFRSYEDWVKQTLDKFREELIDTKNKHLNLIGKEIAQYDKRSLEKMNMVEDKLNSIKIENGAYNFNFKKKSEELEEKLVLFQNISDNIINKYNECKREYLQIKHKFNDLSKYFKTMKLIAPNNNREFYDEMSKRVSIGMNKKQQKRNTENIKYSDILPSITSLEDISKIQKKNDNSVQNFNIEIKESRSKLSKKKSFQNDNLTLSSFNNTGLDNNIVKNINLKQSFKNNNQMLSSNAGNFSILRNIVKQKNNDLVIERKLSNKITLSKKNIKVFTNNFMNEDKREPDLNDDLSINDNIKENEKENNSSYNSEEEEKDKDLNEINNKNNENDMLKDNEIHSNSMSNLATIEQKITGKGTEYNTNKLSSDNVINNSNIVTRINLDEELNKVNQKFDNLYEKANEKIMNIAHQINVLVMKINKSIFNKENVKKIKEIDFSVERRKKNIFLNNPGISLPLAITYEHHYTSAKKENENESSFKNRNLYSNKLNYNIVNINRGKLADFRSNSNDIIELIKNKNDIKKNHVKMIDLNSVNKLESYLIKKFTDPN